MNIYYNDDMPLYTVDLLLDMLQSNGKASHHEFLPTLSTIPISRVVYSGDKTIVWFIDGTKCVVTCSSNDTYDRQTAIAYALVKRLFGKVGRKDEKTGRFFENEVDGNGIGTKLGKIAAAGFDQDIEKKEADSNKAKAKAAHEALQKKQHDEAFERRARKLAEEMRLKARAEEILKEESNFMPKLSGKMLNEASNSNQDNTSKVPGFYEYVRPDKPFSQFTNEEKREYWRAHNAKRRAANK